MGITALPVYDWEAADGVCGGSPARAPVLHGGLRAVNDGDLLVVALMQNSGLPEAGTPC